VARPLFRCRALSFAVGVGAYTASDNALYLKAVWPCETRHRACTSKSNMFLSLKLFCSTYPLFLGDCLTHRDTVNPPTASDEDGMDSIASEPSDWLKAYSTIMLLLEDIIYIIRGLYK